MTDPQPSESPLYWAIVVVLTIIALLVAGHYLPAAEVTPKNPVPEHSLIRVTLAEGERATVIRDGLLMVDQVSVGGGLIWTGPPARYAVLVITDAAIAQIPVVIGQGGPLPPVPPGPTPPIPTPIPNEYGVGKIAYDNALAVGDKAGAKILSEIWSSGSSKLAALNSGDLVNDVNTVSDGIHAASNAQLPNPAQWSTWRTAMGETVLASWRSGNNTLMKMVGVLREVATALELASR